MERTLKDRDIARMCALKAAVELTAAFSDDVRAAAKGNASDIAILAAEKFYRWILAPSPDSIGQEAERADARPAATGSSQPTKDRTNWSDMVTKQCHALQKKLNLPLTNWDKDPCPWGEWRNGGAAALLDTLRDKMDTNTNGNGKPNKPGKGSSGGAPRTPREGLEKLALESGFEDRWKRENHHNDSAITITQYGYAVSLYRKLGIDFDSEFLNGLTAKQASEHIDELKERIGK